MALRSMFGGSLSNPLLPRFEQHELSMSSSRSNHGDQMSSWTGREAPGSSNQALSDARLLALEREESELENEFQELLDAHGEGLVAGLTGQNQEDESISSTSTAAAWGFGEANAISSRKASLGLQGARRAILKTMRELAAIKMDETTILQGAEKDRQEVLDRIARWKKNREDLLREVDTIEASEAGQRVTSLKKDEGNIRQEIHDLETKLFELNAKHRHISAEITELENSIQANESSYKASISLIDSDIGTFLKSPPYKPSRQHRADAADEQSSFFSLNPKRRTLDLATDYFRSDREQLAGRQKKVMLERDALEDGAVVWSDAVKEVIRFEKRLKAEMQRLQASTSLDSNENSLASLLEDMSKTTDSLSSKLALCQARNWKLLVCCIGAELEAFKQGKEILLAGMTGAESTNPPDAASNPPTSSPPRLRSFKTNESSDRASSSSPPAALLVEQEGDVEDPGRRDIAISPGLPHQEPGQDEEDEDQPHPQLMFSQPAGDS